tara:strand:+ start:430 stop:1329 length:900 start_codon:yes stop_codon:yes gene_type:complete
MTLQPTDLTVFIISYYRGDRLRKCIETLSLIPNIIVWDNNTTGEELEKIKQIELDFPKVKVIYSKDNVGFSKACNQGFILSETDWVMFCADDMLFEDDWFSVLNDILKNSPHLEQIHLNAWNAMVFHKKTVVRMGWWDERYRYWPTMDDDDWYLRTVECLGYSPYGTWAEHYSFSEEYLNIIKPYVENKKNLVNKKDNFTHYNNSIYSKYKIIGKSTITGQDNDAGSRNTSKGSIDKKGNMNGVEFHHYKWEPVSPQYLTQPGILLGKDGRVWKRKEGDLDFYPEIRKQYAKKYFNLNL